ncbi:hypothetical protein K443DRAFT_8565 [Laccaria amethystina LaAM-08-1]|uniref:Uncharacterized protein n=1 Tax=Laccaria amethystina LaAM-08-1 TaxID=1095629 RepID=A0A0C9XCE1_9AGAR|nr:hypothetical protein K443DRAFT_8565 [Laccaria amethystina LaAM-08-1]
MRPFIPLRVGTIYASELCICTVHDDIAAYVRVLKPAQHLRDPVEKRLRHREVLCRCVRIFIACIRGGGFEGEVNGGPVEFGLDAGETEIELDGAGVNVGLDGTGVEADVKPIVSYTKHAPSDGLTGEHSSYGYMFASSS